MFAPERQISTNPGVEAPGNPDAAERFAAIAALPEASLASGGQLRPDFSRIGLIGFGAFARLIARHAPADVCLLAYDVASGCDYGRATRANLEEAAACPLVVIAAPVAETARICREIAPLLRAGTLVVDVGSVKLQPVADMQAWLPSGVEIAGLHPLFGPQSAAGGVMGQQLVVCPVRGRKIFRLAALLRRRLGVAVQFATPEAHDRDMAMVQGVTHMVARLVAGLEERPTSMATRSYTLLMKAVNMVRHDNPAVFDAIALRNPFVAGVQEQFFEAASALRHELEARRSASP